MKGRGRIAPRALLVLSAALLLAALGFGCASPEKPPEPTATPAPALTPEPTPAPTPEPTPEPDDGTEKLLLRAKPERVERITYQRPYWEGRTCALSRGDEGFDEALELIFSLRGTRCEAPDILVRMEFDLDPRFTLAWDGEHVYGATNNGYRWLRLDAEGRVDLELAAIFESCGWTAEAIGGPVKRSDEYVNGILTAETEYPVYALEPIAEAIREMNEAYKESGSKEIDERVYITLILVNHSEEDLYYGGSSIALEYRLDGEWHTWRNWSYTYFLLAVEMEPGEREIRVPMTMYMTPLLPGRYRFALDFAVGSGDNKGRTVAYAEFELVSQLPEEAP